MFNSKIPKLRNSQASNELKEKFTSQEKRHPIKRSTYRAIPLDSVPEPIKLPASSVQRLNNDEQQQTSNQNQRRLLNFLHKQKENHTDIYGNEIKSINRKKEKQMKSNRCNKNESITSTADTKIAPFVPSKRMIQHHDYQNVPDDTTNKPNAIQTRDTNKINNRKHSKGLVQQYRHFGDTNILRNNKKSMANKTVINHENKINGNSVGVNRKTTCIPDGIQPYSSHQKMCVYPEIKKQNNINNNNRAVVNGDISKSTSNQYITCDMTNDTGFSSLCDGDTSIIAATMTPINLYSPFNQIKCMNIDVRDRIKMFGVDLSASVSTTATTTTATTTQTAISDKNIHYHQHNNRLNNRMINNKLINNSKNTIITTTTTTTSNHSIHQNNYKQQHSAGSSSNLSSSNSNSSDINSLDSMEHETIHCKNRNNVHATNKKNLLINNVTRSSHVDPKSYLGPFNFRQLLRPTQGPTNSLRKRKCNNLTPSPI